MVHDPWRRKMSISRKEKGRRCATHGKKGRRGSVAGVVFLGGDQIDPEVFKKGTSGFFEGGRVLLLSLRFALREFLLQCPSD
jgi:hypothetical protein